MSLNRSDVEFSTRVFLDRLNANDTRSNHGPGVKHEWVGFYDPLNFGNGADCSGSAGIFIGAAIDGTGGVFPWRNARNSLIPR